MSRLKQKRLHDAGVTNPIPLSREIDDQGGEYQATPRSAYAVGEAPILKFTNRIVTGKDELYNSRIIQQ